MPPVKPSAGFTLIETLVALTVAATAAAVVLALVHGLFRLAERARVEADIATHLLNSSASIAVADTRAGSLAPDAQGIWRLAPPSGEAWPALRVENIELISSVPPPPLAVAHTPYQRFGLEHEGRSLWLIAPAFPGPSATASPVANSNPAAESAAPQPNAGRSR